MGKEQKKVTIENVRLVVVPVQNSLTVVVRHKRRKDTVVRETLAHTRTRRWKELRNSRRRRPVSPIELRRLVDGGAAEGRWASPCGMRHNDVETPPPSIGRHFFFLKRVTNPLENIPPQTLFPDRSSGAYDFQVAEKIGWKFNNYNFFYVH